MGRMGPNDPAEGPAPASTGLPSLGSWPSRGLSKSTRPDSASWGVPTRELRLLGEPESLAALVIPGGESTTMGLLAREYGLLEPLRGFGRTHPVRGTCAGAILLSSWPGGKGKPDDPLRLGLMAFESRRNAMGGQVESFRVDVRIPVLDGLEPVPFPSIFIRAPLRRSLDRDRVDPLATLDDGGIVAMRDGRHLATSLHPELSEDDRFHRYFSQLVRSRGRPRAVPPLWSPWVQRPRGRPQTGSFRSKVLYCTASPTWPGRISSDSSRSAMVRATLRMR